MLLAALNRTTSIHPMRLSKMNHSRLVISLFLAPNIASANVLLSSKGAWIDKGIVATSDAAQQANTANQVPAKQFTNYEGRVACLNRENHSIDMQASQLSKHPTYTAGHTYNYQRLQSLLTKTTPANRSPSCLRMMCPYQRHTSPSLTIPVIMVQKTMKTILSSKPVKSLTYNSVMSTARYISEHLVAIFASITTYQQNKASVCYLRKHASNTVPSASLYLLHDGPSQTMHSKISLA